MTLGYTDGKTKIKIGFLSLGILSIVVLTAFELRKVIAGPKIALSCVTKSCENIVTADRLYPLSGTTSNISDIHIGNRKIYIDTAGKFTEYIVLYPGANSVSISAKDRFGREVKKDISVYYTSITNDTTL
jgi:hypothetical protein